VDVPALKGRAKGLGSLAGMLLGYSLFLASVSGSRPFWLDEILQLIGTRDLSGDALLNYVRGFPGAAPLGYAIQHSAISLLGFSFFSTRASSELSSVLSCLVLIVICRQLFSERTHIWYLVFSWMILPLQLRYALEARPYSQGIFFSALGTLCILSIAARPAPAKGLAYAVIIALGLYSAPYTAFMQAGYVLSLCFTRRSLKAMLPALAGLIGGALAFLPWYLTSTRNWSEALAVANDGGFSLSARFPLMIVREISGGGYYCSIPLIVLAVMGSQSAGISRTAKSILISGIASGLLVALLADAAFGYFFAIRQVLFILVPMIILAAEGFHLLLQRQHRVAAGVLAVLFLAGSLVKDFRYLTDRSEDWAVGANAVRSAARNGACILFTDDVSARLFTFFEPSISRDICGSENAPRVIVPTNRYTRPIQATVLQQRLSRDGFRKIASSTVSGQEISTWEQNAKLRP